jgi:hypothetical protein
LLKVRHQGTLTVHASDTLQRMWSQLVMLYGNQSLHMVAAYNLRCI